LAIPAQTSSDDHAEHLRDGSIFAAFSLRYVRRLIACVRSAEAIHARERSAAVQRIIGVEVPASDRLQRRGFLDCFATALLFNLL
jgi:hypothetical protein